MMNNETNTTLFPQINLGYNSVFKPESLSIGLIVPIEDYPRSAVPTMENHIERVQLAEELGFFSGLVT